MAPSLPRRYSGSSLLWTTPTSNGPASTVLSSRTASGLRSPARRISQVPGQSIAARHPLPPRQAAPVPAPMFFPARAGFGLFGRLATCI